MKLVQYNEYLVNIVDTDGLMLEHQGISSYSAVYAPTSQWFPELYGLMCTRQEANRGSMCKPLGGGYWSSFH